MWALTLHRPWPSAIFDLDQSIAKRVENRNMLPPRIVRGAWLSIHAGKQYAHGVVWPEGTSVPREEECPGGIVGMVRVIGALDRRWQRSGTRRRGVHVFLHRDGIESELRYLDRDPWWIGDVGWLLADAVAIDPVPCRGAQGVWRVPPPIAAEVRRRVRARA